MAMTDLLLVKPKVVGRVRPVSGWCARLAALVS
jgi:hypothetical protein